MSAEEIKSLERVIGTNQNHD